MKPHFKETALIDLEESRDFYDAQELGLGDYFLDRMEEEFLIPHVPLARIDLARASTDL